jgi:hypothetical protein
MWVLTATAATISVSEGEDLQAALDSAVDGDVVEVGPGTWVVQDLRFGGKDLVMRSTDGPQLTVLDGGDVTDTSVVVFDAGEPLTATLQGFTITGGHGHPELWEIGRGWLGAGVYIRNSSATITDCVFVENNSRHSGQSVGAGVAVVRGEALIRDNVFSENLGYWGGGGIGLLEAQASIEGNTFTDNVGIHGGALFVGQDSDADLLSNTFTGNSAGYGGHVFVKDSTLSSVGDVFQQGVAWHNGGALHVQDSHATVVDALFDDNGARDLGGHLWVGWSGGLQVLSSHFRGGSANSGSVALVRHASLTFDGVLLESTNPTAIASLDAQVRIFDVTATDVLGPLFVGVEGTVSVLNVLVSGATNELLEGVTWASSMVWESEDVPDGAIEANPLLDGFVPGPGSPAIDAGTTLYTDADGSPSDIGATGGGSPWSP